MFFPGDFILRSRCMTYVRPVVVCKLFFACCLLVSRFSKFKKKKWEHSLILRNTVEIIKRNTVHYIRIEEVFSNIHTTKGFRV